MLVLSNNAQTLTLIGHEMRGYQYQNRHILKIARLLFDLLTMANVQEFALAGFPKLPNIQAGREVHDCQLFCTICIRNEYMCDFDHPKSELYIIGPPLSMTVLVFAYLVGVCFLKA